jgi:PAS domain S-box-containing protein
MAVVEESLADGESFELIYRVLTEGGETRWAYECGRGVETPEEERDVLEGFITDVTDRKRRERELQRSKRRFESMFEDPNILLGLIDTDGTLLDVNETALEYVDADRREVIGEPFPETPWWDDGDTSDLRRRLDRAADGEYVPYENAHSGPDGTVFVEGTLRPVTDDDGEVTSLIASTRDVTERVRRERRLERQNERFDELADVVSHDLATPITTVKGRLELAAETGDVEHVEAARSALERVDDLREGLVDTLRGRAIVRDTDPVAVGELARAAWKGVADDGAELRLVDPPEVEGDADAVRRLLQNLLSNSVEHGSTGNRPSADDTVEHGGTGVTVRVGAVEEGFYVADDGSGIPEADREDVFTPGFSTKEGGTGMGMASVSQIVDAHGWEIDLEESDSGGARFVIRTRG